MAKKRFSNSDKQYLENLCNELGREWESLHDNNPDYAKGGKDMARHIANRIQESME